MIERNLCAELLLFSRLINVKDWIDIGSFLGISPMVRYLCAVWSPLPPPDRCWSRGVHAGRCWSLLCTSCSSLGLYPPDLSALLIPDIPDAQLFRAQFLLRSWTVNPGWEVTPEESDDYRTLLVYSGVLTVSALLSAPLLHSLHTPKKECLPPSAWEQAHIQGLGAHSWHSRLRGDIPVLGGIFPIPDNLDYSLF